MVVSDNSFHGPLKDILEEAAGKMGFKIIWGQRNFATSLMLIKNGKLDILPRTFRNSERESYVNYLGPIGFQKKNVKFLVKKSLKDKINKYEDLYNYIVGVKFKTSYFKKFNNDKKIKKVGGKDDDNMSRMFHFGRFDVMAIIDVPSIEYALKANKIKDYAYANYEYKQEIGNYYGMSKYYEKLNKILIDMTKSGRVTEIYRKHKVEPPFQK